MRSKVSGSFFFSFFPFDRFDTSSPALSDSGRDWELVCVRCSTHVRERTDSARARVPRCNVTLSRGTRRLYAKENAGERRFFKENRPGVCARTRTHFPRSVTPLDARSAFYRDSDSVISTIRMSNLVGRSYVALGEGGEER